jgi:hypothetical protein
MAKAIRTKVEESVHEMFHSEEGLRKIVESVVQVGFEYRNRRALTGATL